MLETLLRTKLYIPPLRPNLVPRPKLIDRLNQGLQLGHKLTLVSTPAGYGKTTLVSEWVQAKGGAIPPIAIAWLSLDKSENDPTRFLAHFVAALRTIEANIGKGVLSALQSPQLPRIYELRIDGHLGSQWSNWFDGLSITLEDDGQTLMTGPLVDQAALHRLLKKVARFRIAVALGQSC
jgi:ATP/maltotriose-dependent transcriptional regulator MalT